MAVGSWISFGVEGAERSDVPIKILELIAKKKAVLLAYRLMQMALSLSRSHSFVELLESTCRCFGEPAQ